MTQRPAIALDRSRRVALTAVMSALALVANYVFVLIPNVELGSSVLFITGFLFGMEMAGSSVIIMAIIFGIFNPWGASIVIIEIWVAQIIGWLFIATAGHIMGQRGRRAAAETYTPAELGIIGAVITVFYDLVTNVGMSLSTGVPFLVTLLAGLPFMIVHVISNGIIFAFAIIRLDNAIRRNLGSVLWRQEDSEPYGTKSKKTVISDQL